jgi:O-phosphoseryl-tRNA(Cys) synthetase
MFMENKSINEEVSRIIEIMGGNDENSLEKEVEIMKANRKFKTEMDLLNSVISRLSDSTQKQDWSIVEDVIKDLIKYQEESELEDEWISSWNLRVPQLPWER